MAFLEEDKKHTLFEKKCHEIFEWVGYRTHTRFHVNRFPLIGDWVSWQQLKTRLTIDLKGRLPEEENHNERTEHVLDAILFYGQKLSDLKLHKTDMYTILFVDDTVPKLEKALGDWRVRLKQINGSIVLIDHEVTRPEQPSDDFHTDIMPNPNLFSAPNRSNSRDDILRLISKTICNSNNVDLLSTIFHDIKNMLSDYQEQKVRDLMKECGALVYNDDLIADYIPDGYYLCNTKCLARLEDIFSREPHTFATNDFFRVKIPPDQYILLTVEVKLSLDSLQTKLIQGNYYIFSSAPHPIRHLVIANGGQITHTWLFLINLVHIQSINRNTRIDRDIYMRVCQIVQHLRVGRTHIVYMPSFCSETFRQEPLTQVRLNILCELAELEQKIAKSKPAGRLSGVHKRKLEIERNIKRQVYYEKAFGLLNRFMREHPIRKPKPSINFWILQHTEMHTDERLCSLERLALSILYEVQENVSKANQNIELPFKLKKRAHELRSVRPVPFEEPIPILRYPAFVSQASFPGDTDDENDDSTKIGEQAL